MKIDQFREQTTEELQARSRELKHEMLHLRIQKATGQLENKSGIRTLRKQNARIETILSERRHGASVGQPIAKNGTASKSAESAAGKKEKAPPKKAAVKK